MTETVYISFGYKRGRNHDLRDGDQRKCWIESNSEPQLSTTRHDLSHSLCTVHMAHERVVELVKVDYPRVWCYVSDISANASGASSRLTIVIRPIVVTRRRIGVRLKHPIPRNTTHDLAAKFTEVRWEWNRILWSKVVRLDRPLSQCQQRRESPQYNIDLVDQAQVRPSDLTQKLIRSLTLQLLTRRIHLPFTIHSQSFVISHHISRRRFDRLSTPRSLLIRIVAGLRGRGRLPVTRCERLYECV